MSPRNVSAALATVVAAAGLLLPASGAAAATDAPGWMIDSVSYPTNLTPGDTSGHDLYRITAIDVGGAQTDGTPITVTDTLPAGLTPDPAAPPTATDSASNTISCATAGQVVTCTDPDTKPITLATSGISGPGGIRVTVPVDVGADAPSSVTNDVSVSGGAATGAQNTEQTTISAAPAAFAAQGFDQMITNADGSTDTQAGSHPYEITTTFAVSSELASNGAAIPVANADDIRVDLPPGLVGNPLATPRCTQAQFNTGTCPPASQVGTSTVLQGLTQDKVGAFTTEGPLPVYNMVPPAGMPAQFAFSPGVQLASVYLDASVRTGSDYGLTLTAHGIPETQSVIGDAITFWGVPGDPSHNSQRSCGTVPATTGCSSDAPVQPFLTLPSTCDGPQTTTLGVDSWQNPGAFQTTSVGSHVNQGNPVTDTGCGSLGFSPSLSVQPTTSVADSPSGAVADLQVPQNDDPDGLATPELRDATVRLPAGLSLSPGAATGLVGCSAVQIALQSAAPATCPDASKVGTVTITTPLLPDPLTGSIFIGTPDCSPCTDADAADGSMVHGYIQAQADGVLVKLPGTFDLDPSTGQITAKFLNNPQLPFSDLKLSFNGGSRGVLATPDGCGTYSTTSDLSPWSSPFSPDVSTSDSFGISSGCVSGFSPSFTAGTQTATAGAYSPFVLSFSRSDGDQEIRGLSASLPAGMLARLTGVPLCPDAAANAGSCSSASQVGTVTVAAGPGPDPFFLSGRVYLTGAYKGGQYGLAVVVPAVAGPFNLGMVVVRQALEIDADRARVTAVSDPFPTIRDGIPLRIQRVDVNLNRPGFTVNPTSCDPVAVTGTLSSTGGLTHAVSSRFQVGGCSSLGFSPSLSVSPDTHTADSPSGLSVDLRFPQSGLTSGSGRSQASLRDASVALPAGVSLDPSAATGLTGCSESQIALSDDQSPAACPDSSRVGTATIDTPLLPDPLTGSIFLAQQNQNPFHSLLAVYVAAQGDGVLVKLAGHVVADPVTGQLTTTFSNNPQVPFSDLRLDFRGGSRGVLATPGACGSYTASSSLTPWAGNTTASPSSRFAVAGGCQTGFAPSLSVATRDPRAGAFSPFTVSFGRSDADQFLRGLSVKLPDGMLAKLAGVQQCTTAELAAAAGKTGAAEQADPSCPAGSLVGTVTTRSGVGPDPFSLAGRAYLTGPYKGAPFGLAVVVPALAGPFDLGTVVVRQQLQIDPTSAQVTVVSDPFPTILEGIPLRIRRVSVDLSRPGFTVNPTSCGAKSATAAFSSTGGLTHAAGSRVRVGDCSALGFAPRLAIDLSGKGQTRSGDHPTLTANLTNPSRTANIKTAKVTLPLSLALDPDNSMHVCGFTTAAKVHGGRVGCKPSTVVGSATAVTPLLDRALSGKVYLVQGLRCQKGQPNVGGKCPHGQTAIRTLPSLLVALRGQIALDLRAQTSTSHGKLQTTFKQIPDAPVSKFTLNIKGGRKGLLVITGRGRSICTSEQVGNARFGAQSDKTTQHNMRLSTPCKPAKAASPSS